MEHSAIGQMQTSLAVIPDRQPRDTLNELLLEEKQHEQALVARIRQLGGDPYVEYEPSAQPADVSILDLLDRHRDEELRTQKHYELGLSRFEEPEFQWMLGQLNLEEQRHIAELDKLTEKYRSADVLPPELKKLKWVDPYMGPPGERPWIE